jgi:hypothetical protein
MSSNQAALLPVGRIWQPPLPSEVGETAPPPVGVGVAVAVDAAAEIVMLAPAATSDGSGLHSIKVLPTRPKDIRLSSGSSPIAVMLPAVGKSAGIMPRTVSVISPARAAATCAVTMTVGPDVTVAVGVGVPVAVFVCVALARPVVGVAEGTAGVVGVAVATTTPPTVIVPLAPLIGSMSMVLSTSEVPDAAITCTVYVVPAAPAGIGTFSVPKANASRLS